ncbi:HAD family hydrolase [Candidatus Riflebacteria bacterium]
MEKFQALIFDVDGVLLDSGEFHKKAWRAFAAKNSLSLADNFFEQIFGMTNQDIMPQLFGRALNPDELTAFAEEKELIFREEAGDGLTLFPGVGELLSQLKDAAVSMSFATSTPASNVDFYLEELGLATFFKHYCTGDDITKGKPDPDIFLLAADKMAVKADSCLVFEDSFPGMQAVKAANMGLIAVTTSHSREEIVQHFQPELIISQPGNMKITTLLAMLQGKN